MSESANVIVLGPVVSSTRMWPSVVVTMHGVREPLRRPLRLRVAVTAESTPECHRAGRLYDEGAARAQDSGDFIADAAYLAGRASRMTVIHAEAGWPAPRREPCR
jgi:hypothetical protein